MRFPRMSTNNDWTIDLVAGKAQKNLAATSLLGLCAVSATDVSIVTSVTPNSASGVHTFVAGGKEYTYTVATGAVAAST